MFQIYAGNSLVYEPGDMDLALLTPKLTLEMGKAGSLEFTVPAGHPYMNELKQLTKPVSVDLDGEKVFRGRILSGTRTFYNQREVYCEGDLSYLIDSVQKAVKFNGKTHALFRQIIANHNARMPAEKQFTVGNITVENRDIILTGQSDDISQYDYKQIAINSVVDNWNTTYDYIETCLISYCGGYLVTRRVGDTTYIDWINDYTSTASQEIVFGENLLDLQDETSAEDIFTVLIPIGDNNLTIKTVNNNSDEIVDSAKVAKYGRIVKTNVFSNVTNPQTLLENGRRYLANNGDVPTTLTLTAVDLHSVYPEITAIHLGDRVYIRSDPHGLSQYLTCTKIEYDLERLENTVYTFGREKQSLTQRYREDKRAQSDTYNNSANGGGGIGSTASAMGANWKDATDDCLNKSKEETTKQLDEFYDAWVDWDESQGKVSLGAMYKKLLKDEEVLKNNVGIDMDAPSGTIDIYADHRSVEETKNSFGTVKTVLENNLGIDFNAPQGTINIYADHNKITETATDIGKVTKVLKQNAGLDINSPEGTVSIYATASLANNANGKANDAQTKTARILAWAGEDEYGNIGTRIALEADLVKVSNRLEAVEGVFDSVTGNVANFKTNISTSSYFGNHYFINSIQGDSIDLVSHYHTVYVDSNNKLYLGPPVGDQNHTDIGLSIKPVFGA